MKFVDSDEKIGDLLRQILEEVRLLRQEVRRQEARAVGDAAAQSQEALRREALRQEAHVDGDSSTPSSEAGATVKIEVGDTAGGDSTVRPRATGGIPAAAHGGSLAEEALLKCGVRVKVLKKFPEGQDAIDSLAVFLGSRYSSLNTLLARIKSRVADGGDISLSLRNETQEAVSNVCQFCTRLHAMAYLRRYHYLKSPHYQAYLTVSPEPFAQVFFNGAWLERYALYVLAKVCARAGAGVIDYLSNPSVYLPNGDDFELDVFAVSRGRPIWVEAKSGDYQIHVAKYARLVRQLGLQGRFVLLASGCPTDNCQMVAAAHGIRVANCETFEATLEEMLNEDMMDVCGHPDVAQVG